MVMVMCRNTGLYCLHNIARSSSALEPCCLQTGSMVPAYDRTASLPASGGRLHPHMLFLSQQQQPPQPGSDGTAAAAAEGGGGGGGEAAARLLLLFGVRSKGLLLPKPLADEDRCENCGSYGHSLQVRAMLWGLCKDDAAAR